AARGAAALGAGPAALGHAARPAPFFRHPSARPRRRSEGDPGTARPCVAVDHADLYGGRHRPAARKLRESASAGLTRRSPARAVALRFRQVRRPCWGGEAGLAPEPVVRRNKMGVAPCLALGFLAPSAGSGPLTFAGQALSP